MAGTDLLTDSELKRFKPRQKPYKRSDGDGMYVLVNPDGSKYWRLKYRVAGREKLLSLGVYPDTTLKSARNKRREARQLLANGVDPSKQRQADKKAARDEAENTFEVIGREWMQKRGGKWSPAHAAAVKKRLEVDLFPKLGRLPVVSVDSEKLLEVLRGIEARGAHEIAAKARTFAGQVFRYAIVTSRATKDPTPQLRGALEVVEKRHYARLNEDDLPEFLAKLDAYDGSPITKLAMSLLTLTFVRTGELRAATWEEFDMDKREWRIPGERMKMRQPHIVPLSDQAIAALTELQRVTGGGKLLFPNEHHPDKPMSENTILYALYRMGYRGRATGHGFRATASTILNEQKWKPDAIERQLAHREKNASRAAYHHTEYLLERRKMMQAWADFLDIKRSQAENVVNIGRKQA